MNVEYSDSEYGVVFFGMTVVVTGLLNREKYTYSISNDVE